MTAHDDEQLDLGLTDLRRFQRGHASFTFDAAGGLQYSGTEATVKMHPDETIPAFVARLRRDHDLQSGDVLTLLNNNGELNIARIEKKPRERAA